MIRYIISAISLIVVFLMIFFVFSSYNTKDIWSSGTVISKDDSTQTVTVQEGQDIHKITIANKAVYDKISIRGVLKITYEYNVKTSSKRNVRPNPSCNNIILY